MEAVKICIVLTVLAMMARYTSRLLLAGVDVNAGLARWIDRLHFHWVVIVWILYLFPFHPYSLIFAAATLLYSSRYIREFPLVTVLFLVLTLPMLERRIPGMAGIDSLIFFGWPLAVSLLVYFLARSNPGKWADITRSTRWLLVLFFLFIFLLSFRGTSFTDGIRVAVNYAALFFLTAAVASKSRSEEWIACIVYTIIAVGLLTAFISIFESLKGWLLFVPMLDTYGTSGSESISLYKFREGFLRSLTSQGNLQTGLILSTALVALVLLRRQLVSQWVFYALFAVLAAGLMCTFSRGSLLVGGAIILLFELLRSRSASIPKMMLFLGMLYGILVFTGLLDVLQRMFEIKDDFNFNYRILLFDESVIVILNHFFLGTESYIDILASKGLIQGEGIVDIVNTYLQIGLEFGGVALTIYVLMLLAALARAAGRISPKARKLGNGSSLNVYWLVLTAAMLNVIIQSSSVSVLGYNGIFVFILLLVSVSSLPVRHEAPRTTETGGSS